MTTIKDSRESILAAIKKSHPSRRPLPEVPVFDVPGNPLTNFISHLLGFDGRYRLFATRNEAVAWLQRLAGELPGETLSAIPDVRGNVTLDQYGSEGQLESVGTCIATAILAVGETGSLLVDVQSLGSPAAALFATDLYLLVDRESLVASMQEAYEKTDLTASSYSSFFSGPSATADIEAVHITGAQGEISLTAVVYNVSDTDREAINAIVARLPKGTPLGQPDAPQLEVERATDIGAGRDSV